jgi:ADP-heptose:LPS heptosyltransferase
MKKFRFKLEDYARSLAWYFDYLKFRLKNPIQKQLPKQVKSILIIDLKRIGDLIMDTPTIRTLKQHYNADISILVPEDMKEILYNNPNLKNIYTSKEEIKEIFDLGILLYPGNKEYSNFLKNVAKFRMGIRKSGLTEPKGYHLHRKTIPTFKIKHKIDDNLDVIKPLTTKDKHTELYLKKETTKYKDYFIINPISKTHPTLSKEKFAILADKVQDKYKKNIIFTGAKEDIPFIESIQHLMKNKSINLAGKTTLQEYFSLVKNSSFVISIDTSAPHVAAAFNIPVISIFSAGDKKIWYPYSKNSIAIQSKNTCTACMKSECSLKGKYYLECVKPISVEYILNQLSKLI